MSNYIAWSKDNDNLQKSSSGGIFFELAKKTLKNNGAVMGVIMDKRKAIYIFTNNLNIIKKMRGSKYIKAHLDDSDIWRMKSFKRNILFVGLPCQIKRVMKLFKNRDNILYIELRCHGVIKKDIFNKHLNQVCKEKDNYLIENIKFRDKLLGWKNSLVLHIDFRYNEIYHMRDKLIKDFLKKKNLENRCKVCRLKGYGDIILGDYWECPEKYKNKLGTSKVVTNSIKGSNFFESLKNIESYKYDNYNVGNKIAIIKGADFQNNGNLIMTQNFIYYLSKMVKDVKFVVVDHVKNISAKKTIDYVLNGLNINIDYRYYNEWEWLSKEKIFGYVKGKSKIEKLLYDCNTVVYLGGDHFLGVSKWFLWVFTCLDLLSLKKSGKQVYLVSQTIGYFPKYLKPLIKFTFKKLDRIYCRDRMSINELKKLNIIDNVSLSSDLAFLPLYKEKQQKHLFDLLTYDYITFTISDLYRLYSETELDFVNDICKVLKEMCNITNLPLYIMTHSCTDSEKHIIKNIQNRISDVRINFLPKMHPLTARVVLGHSKLNVSFRMHSTLSSLQQNVPVIPIAYGVKYKAVYSDLKLDELVVEGLDVKEILYKVKYVWSMKDYYPNKIKIVLKHTKKNAIKPILEIAKEVSKTSF